MSNAIPEGVCNFLKGRNLLLEECLIEEYRHKCTHEGEEIRNVAKRLFFERIVPYYEKNNLLINNSLFFPISEALKNANFHGSSSLEEVQSTLFLSRKALIWGLNDGGPYFKRPEVKKYWENREAFPEKHVCTENIKELNLPKWGYGVGTSAIYDNTDWIHIDNCSGTLYLGFFVPGNFFRELSENR